MEAIFDFFGDAFFGAVIMVGLDNKVVQLTPFGGAVSGTVSSLEILQGVKHGIFILAVNGKAILFRLASAASFGCGRLCSEEGH